MVSGSINLFPFTLISAPINSLSANFNFVSSNEVILDDVTLSISLLIDMIEMGIEQGYYLQIIDLLAKVKKLCSLQKCNNCEQTVCTSCSKFKQI